MSGAASASQEDGKLRRLDCRIDEEAHTGMVGADAAAEQVEGEPAALVVVLGLVGEERRGEGLAEIVGLDELRVGPHRSDRAHGEHRRRGIG